MGNIVIIKKYKLYKTVNDAQFFMTLAQYMQNLNG